MKRKHGSESLPVRVITDPKKLAWLKAQIAKRKNRNGKRTISQRTFPDTE
jgi:hypothetical protein